MRARPGRAGRARPGAPPSHARVAGRGARRPGRCYQLVPDATEALSGERVALEQALRDGGPAGAVEAWLAARGAGPERIARAREDSAAFFADYAGLATLSVLRRDLRELRVPAAVLGSPGAPEYVRATAQALAEVLGVEVRPEAELVATLEGLSVSQGRGGG